MSVGFEIVKLLSLTTMVLNFSYRLCYNAFVMFCPTPLSKH